MSVITQQVRANADTIVAGVGSGGGGGGGGDITVSSLTVSSDGYISLPGPPGFCATIQFASTNQGIANLRNALQFNDNTSSNPGVVSLQLESGYMAPLQVSEIDFNGQPPGTIAAATYIRANPNTNVLAVATGGGYVDMSLAPLQVSSLTVSSINGAQPGGAIPEDLSVNSLTAAVSVTAADVITSTIKVSGFLSPIQQYGAATLDGGGSTIVGLDYTYADPWYPFANYKGEAPVSNVQALFTSTLTGDSFLITGQPNLPVIWHSLGN